LWPIAVGLLYALAVFAAAAEEQPPAEAVAKLLQNDDKTLETLSTTKASEESGQSHKDRRSRTIAQDMQDNVLTPNVRDQLDALRASAREHLAAGRVSEAQTAAVSFHQLLRDQVMLHNAVGDYWREYGSREDAGPWREGYASALMELDIEVPEMRETAELSAKLDEQIAAGQFIEAMNVTSPALKDTFKRASAAAAEQIRLHLENGSFKPSAEAVRCRPAARSSGNLFPLLAKDFPNSENFNPHTGNGATSVLVIVSAEGCALSAIVVVPSGMKEIDTATRRLALAGKYVPGERDGVRIPGLISFRVKFEVFR